MTRRWIDSITTRASEVCAREGVRTLGLTVYYLAILVAVVALHGRADSLVATYVYQDF